MSTEQTSARVASLAARGLADPASLSPQEIREVCASCLTQAPDEDARDPEPAGPGFVITP